MRKSLTLFAALLACTAWLVELGIAAQPAGGEQYVGTWSGTWEGGGGSGRFDLTIERGSDGKIGGGVSVGEPTGNYVAKFKSISFDGNKLSARYDYTPNTQTEIVLAATFTDGGADGAWSMVPQAQEMVLANGTWKVSKK